MNTSKRVYWIDVLKYICIMFVMLCHLESHTDLLKSFYEPFFLNGFYFASGYVYKNGLDFGTHVKKKAKGLLLPWLIYSVLNILASQVLSFNEHTSIWKELGWNFAQIRGKGDGVWFVAALFVIYIPFYFLIKVYERRNTGRKSRVFLIVFTLVLWVLNTLYVRFMPMDILPWGNVCYPWHLEFIGWAMLPMSLGYMFRTEYEEKFDTCLFGADKTQAEPAGHESTKFIRHPATIIILLSLVYILVAVVPYLLGVTIEKRTALIPWNLVCIMLGLVLLIAVSKCINKPGRYVLFIGQNTLLCFALHGKVYSILETCMHKFVGGTYNTLLNNEWLSSLLAVFVSIAISLILIIPIYVINRWLPFTLGRSAKRG